MALIKGQKYLVPDYPYTINITNIGIDRVEAIAYQFNYNIENSANVDQTAKTQIRKIYKENGPSSKIAAVLGYVKKIPNHLRISSKAS